MTEISSMTPIANPLNVDEAVRKRYDQAANNVERQLCCPVDYDDRYLELIPQEIVSRDYGCGDPSQHVSAGETVLDLGSGAGKICYIAAQVVGKNGHVIGIDCNDEMLALARKHQDAMSQRLGFANVEFRKGKIQDLTVPMHRRAPAGCRAQPSGQEQPQNRRRLIRAHPSSTNSGTSSRAAARTRGTSDTGMLR